MLMLFHCQFTWHPGTTMPQVGARLLEEAEASAAFASRIRGWYVFPAEGRGFLLVETDDLQTLAPRLSAYNDLMSWHIQPVVALEYGAVIEQVRGAQTVAAG
jgi:hypothetical protein